MAEEERVGSDTANLVVDSLLYSFCLWVVWRVGARVGGWLWGTLGVLIDGAVLLRVGP